MLDRRQAQDVVRYALERSPASETEVRVASCDRALTRFANSVIHQNMAKAEQSVTVRVRTEHRVGECTGNCLDKAHLDRLITDAMELARASSPDEQLLPCPAPVPCETIPAWDGPTALVGPADRAETVKIAVSTCRKANLTAAGALETVSETVWFANSRGLKVEHASTAASMSVTAQGGDSSGWAAGYSHAIKDIDPAALARTAAEKAAACPGSRSIEPGAWPVILEADAFSELVAYLGWGFNATSISEGRSYLSGRLGEEATGPRVNLESAPSHPLVLGCPFDGEGMPNRPLRLFDAGKVASLAYDRYTAPGAGAQPSGYSAGGASREGSCPGALVFAGADATVEQMVSSADRAVLVTRIWYTGLVDPRRLIVTGMTRDGTFLVEKGRMTAALKNLRFNVPLLSALRTIEALGAPKRCARAVAPPVMLREFPFTSTTEF